MIALVTAFADERLSNTSATKMKAREFDDSNAYGSMQDNAAERTFLWRYILYDKCFSVWKLLFGKVDRRIISSHNNEKFRASNMNLRDQLA